MYLGPGSSFIITLQIVNLRLFFAKCKANLFPSPSPAAASNFLNYDQLPRRPHLVVNPSIFHSTCKRIDQLVKIYILNENSAKVPNLARKGTSVFEALVPQCQSQLNDIIFSLELWIYNLK